MSLCLSLSLKLFESPLKASKPFLSLFLVRHRASSRDIILKRVLVQIDDLEVDMDADMLNGLNVRRKPPSEYTGLKVSSLSQSSLC